MIIATARTYRRALFAASLLAVSLVVGGLAAPRAGAIMACRTDPVVFLSNGVKINLSATLYNAKPSDVRQITYLLHAPAGVTVTNVVYTGGAFSHRESFQFVADDTPNSYDSTTFVDTVNTGISVTATSQAAGNDAGSSRVSANGQDHQNIPVHVSM